MESVEELCDHIALINNSHKIIDGTKREIKNKFRTNTYYIEYRGNLSGQNGNYTILNKEKIEDDLERSTIQLNNDFTTNDLLGVLINEIEISSFIENIPSMNEIFIEIVKKVENE